MQELVNKWLNDKATFIVETTNGYHFYFDSDEQSFSNAVRISDFVDVRGDGGCVFCYTEDPQSNYQVICSVEPLPLTLELVEYISLQERDSKSIEYTFDASHTLIAVKPHEYNKLMAKGIARNDDNIILKSAKFTPIDFEEVGGLYSKAHRLAFILAMNPACKNEYVQPYIEHLITKYSGFDISSDESQKRLHQIFSNMIYCDESKKDMREVLKECSVQVDSNLELLHKDLLFLQNGSNLVMGESKSGKTFTTLKSLVDVGLGDKIIHVDFDRNADKKLEELSIETYHINDASQLLQKLESNKEYEPMRDKIIVIDSLQDLGLDGIDTNIEALKTMNRVALFSDTGATIIIIHHITLEKVGNGKQPKIKGNSSTISSKCDVAIQFEKDKNKRSMKVLFSRAEDILSSGSTITFNGTKRLSVLQNASKD